MTFKTWALLATLGSALLIMAALGFQFIGEMPPCKLCHWQRYGHYLAIAAGLLTLAFGKRILAVFGLVGAAWSAGIGAYHTGVERRWWEGPNSCTSGSVSGMSTDDLFDQIMAAPLIRCDEVPWDMFGLSMASWNMLASVVLVGLWIMALRARS